MKTIKDFLATKQAKSALWTVLNSFMAIVVSFIMYMASDNVGWAISILPIAQAFSQFLTKTINSK